MTRRERFGLFLLKSRQPFGAFFSWLATFIGFVGGLAGLAALYFTNETTREWVLSLAISVIAIVSLLALAWREIRLSDDRKFASTLPHLQHASSLLGDVRTVLRAAVDEAEATGDSIPLAIRGKLKRSCEEILTSFSAIYTAWTSTNCRASIKLVRVVNENGVNEVYVHTLARDKSSALENNQHDKTRAEKNHDRLSDNSDFIELWDETKPDKGYFIAYDLKNDQTYNTSSLSYWNIVVGSPVKRARIEWPLPYKSTIVWPIRQKAREDLGIDETSCVGFLCIDSRVPGAFRTRDHPKVGTILADALYPILHLYANEIETRIDRAAAGVKNG